MSDQKLDRIETKIDRITDHISAIDATLASQHVSLAEHMRRTELLEQTIVPIQRHVTLFQGGVKFLGTLIVMVTLTAAITEILTYLRHK